MGFEGIIDLDELARLEKAATPGPWNSYSAMCCPDMGGVSSEGSPYNVCKAGVGRYGHPMSIEDAEFVAYARNALPELIAELTRLRELEAAVLGCYRTHYTVENSVNAFEERYRMFAAIAACRKARGT